MSARTRRRVVISQPMLFPWVGMMELVKQADVYVHYDDVQFSKGSFVNRVQVKTARGSEWLTIPLRELHLGTVIKDVHIDDRQDWRKRHLELLESAYASAPFVNEMLELVRGVYDVDTDLLEDVVIGSLRALADYWNIRSGREHFVSELETPGRSWERVLRIVQRLEGTEYLTAHGAKDYLNHEAFDASRIAVRYIDYARMPYRQLHGEFDPHISALDLLANLGPRGSEVFLSGTLLWKEFLAQCQK